MYRYLLKSKIHGAIVTDADVRYEGSLTIDETLMTASNIAEYERVVIWDVTNGARIETYAIKGKQNSRVICANGAAAHHIKKGDEIIIATFASYEEKEEVKKHKPIKIFVDKENRMKK